MSNRWASPVALLWKRHAKGAYFETRVSALLEGLPQVQKIPDELKHEMFPTSHRRSHGEARGRFSECLHTYGQRAQ